MIDPTTQIAAVIGLVQQVLGTDALGAYLHGSAVLGELRPRSDTDILVVARRGLTDEERRTITRGVMALSGRRAADGPARSVELTIVVAGDVRPWRYPPRAELQYGEWLRARYEAGELAAAEDRCSDLAPLMTMVLQGDRPLFGPRPGELLDPVPAGDLRRAIVAGIPSLLTDLDDDTANVVLTFARIWTTLATGEIRAKDQAADWALARLAADLRPVLERARDIYLGAAEDRWDDLRSRVRPHVDAVLAQIERAEAGAGLDPHATTGT